VEKNEIVTIYSVFFFFFLSTKCNISDEEQKVSVTADTQNFFQKNLIKLFMSGKGTANKIGKRNKEWKHNKKQAKH